MPPTDQLLELSVLTLALLIGAAFLAGWVDAVVGGGGLIQLPALLANVLGGYLGARLALRLGSGFVRGEFLVVTGALALRLAIDSVALLT